MEDPLCSIFNYQESCEELMQKLVATTHELENMKKGRVELLNLLQMAYQERDEARQQLEKLLKKLVPQTSANMFLDFPLEGLVPLPTPNSGITESNSPSHVSSTVDSLLEPVSSPEFSNINVVDSNNLGYLNHRPLVNSASPSPALISSKKPNNTDYADAIIDYYAKGKALPQKGKLVEAVQKTGPLLQLLLAAGPLPSWQNSPPMEDMKIPPFEIKNFDFNANMWNTFQKSTPASSHSSLASPIMLNNNIASISTNNAWQLNSNSNNAPCKNRVPSRIPLNHQYLM